METSALREHKIRSGIWIWISGLIRIQMSTPKTLWIHSIVGVSPFTTYSKIGRWVTVWKMHVTRTMIITRTWITSRRSFTRCHAYHVWSTYPAHRMTQRPITSLLCQWSGIASDCVAKQWQDMRPSTLVFTTQASTAVGWIASCAQTGWWHGSQTDRLL